MIPLVDPSEAWCLRSRTQLGQRALDDSRESGFSQKDYVSTAVREPLFPWDSFYLVFTTCSAPENVAVDNQIRLRKFCQAWQKTVRCSPWRGKLKVKWLQELRTRPYFTIQPEAHSQLMNSECSIISPVLSLNSTHTCAYMRCGASMLLLGLCSLACMPSFQRLHGRVWANSEVLRNSAV